MKVAFGEMPMSQVVVAAPVELAMTPFQTVEPKPRTLIVRLFVVSALAKLPTIVSSLPATRLLAMV